MKNSTGASELVSTGPCKVPICEIITQEPLFTRNIQMEKTAWLVSSRAGSPLSVLEFQYSFCCPNFQDKVMNRKRGFVSEKRKSVWYHGPHLHLFPWERKLLCLTHARHFICSTCKPKKKKKAKILKCYNSQVTEEEAEATGDCVWKLRSTQMSHSTWTSRPRSTLQVHWHLKPTGRKKELTAALRSGTPGTMPSTDSSKQLRLNTIESTH